MIFLLTIFYFTIFTSFKISFSASRRTTLTSKYYTHRIQLLPCPTPAPVSGATSLFLLHRKSSMSGVNEKLQPNPNPLLPDSKVTFGTQQWPLFNVQYLFFSNNYFSFTRLVSSENWAMPDAKLPQKIHFLFSSMDGCSGFFFLSDEHQIFHCFTGTFTSDIPIRTLSSYYLYDF